MGALRGRAGAARVLGLLPPELAAHAPLPQGLARALRGARAVVVSVHCPGFRGERRRGCRARRGRAARIEHPVLLDTDFALWQDYENAGWPGRYLWGPDGHRCSTTTTARAPTRSASARSASSLGRRAASRWRRCGPRTRPAPLALPDRGPARGAFGGPYEAGAVWAVLDGPRAACRVNGRALAVEHPGAYLLVEHERHTRGELEPRARRRACAATASASRRAGCGLSGARRRARQRRARSGAARFRRRQAAEQRSRRGGRRPRPAPRPPGQYGLSRAARERRGCEPSIPRCGAARRWG